MCLQLSTALVFAMVIVYCFIMFVSQDSQVQVRVVGKQVTG